MKILVIDSHAIVWHGISHLFSSSPDTSVLEASTAEAALVLARCDPPDVYVLDPALDRSGRLSLLGRIREQDASARILIFSAHVDVALANRALRSGACGFVTKSAPVEDLRRAIELVSDGKPFIDHELMREIVRCCANGDPAESQLTDREKKILHLLSKGHRIKDIASEFGLASRTISNALTRIKGKLNLHKMSDLIRHSVEMHAHAGLEKRRRISASWERPKAPIKAFRRAELMKRPATNGKGDRGIFSVDQVRGSVEPQP